jgi:hypothetical protein
MSDSHLDGLLDELVSSEPREGWDDVLQRARHSQRHYTALVLVVAALVLAPTTWAAVRLVQGSPVECVTPQVRSLLLVSTRTGRVETSFPDTRNSKGQNAQPLSVASDGQGGWFIAGGFLCVGTVRVPGLAHLRPNGHLDATWQGQLPQGIVTGAFRSGRTLFAVGRAAHNTEWITALDSRTGSRRWLVTGLEGLGALAVTGTRVFVGHAATDSRSVVALDRRTGAILPWHVALPGQFGRKLVGTRFVIAGHRLFVSAVTAGRIPAEGIFAFDIRTGRLTDWRAPQIKYANVWFATHGLIFFSNLAGTYVASARSGRPVTAFGKANFNSFALLGDTLYADIGCNGPSKIQGQTRTLAAINLRTRKVTPWTPAIYPRAPQTPVCIQAMAADNRQLLLSGYFQWKPYAKTP